MATGNIQESAREYKLHGSQEYSDICVIEYDLRCALQALSLIRNELVNQQEQEDQFAIEMNWIAAVVKFCRCFEKSRAKKISLNKSMFLDGFENGIEAFDYIKNHRDKVIVHDESPLVQNQTVVFPSPDHTRFGVGNFMMFGCVDEDHVTCLGQLCEIAMRHVSKRKAELQKQIFESVDRLGNIEWVLKQPKARLVVPGRNALAENRKDWTLRAAAKSRKEKS
jgi:hypothetical protein